MECRTADIAYCAGMFDSEGCLSVTPYPKGRIHYHNDLWLGMQNLTALEFFQKTVGVGKIGRRKDVWMYRASGPRATHVLRLLIPCLIIKREAAEEFLKFQATFIGRAPYRLPEEVMEERRRLSERIRDLSRKDSRAFHINGVNSVKVSTGDNTEPSRLNGKLVERKVYRLEGEEPSNTPSTSAPPEREELVGAA